MENAAKTPARPTKELGQAFIDECMDRLYGESLPRLRKCMSLLDPDLLWTRPGPTTVSAGNLVLHLSGNVTQWILTGLADDPDDLLLEVAVAKRLDHRLVRVLHQADDDGVEVWLLESIFVFDLATRNDRPVVEDVREVVGLVDARVFRLHVIQPAPVGDVVVVSELRGLVTHRDWRKPSTARVRGALRHTAADGGKMRYTPSRKILP